MKMISVWNKTTEAVLVLLAFLLPFAFYLRTYDSALVKALTLDVGAALVLALALARFAELGRLEMPANRTGLCALGLALLGWVGLTFAFNPYPEASFSGAIRLGVFVSLFLVALTGPASYSFSASLSDWTLGAALVASAYSALQWVGLDPFVWKGAFGERAFSTLANPDLLGVFLGAAAALGLARSLEPERPLPWRAGALITSLLCGLGVLVSGSAVGLLAFCASSAAYALVSLSHLRSRAPRVLGLAAAALVPALLWATFQFRGAALEQRILSGVEHSTWVQRGALQLLKDNLWLGTGAGGFAPSYPPYRPPRTIAIMGRHNTLVTSAHSEPLEIACELGLPGLLLWIALFGGVLLVGWRDTNRRSLAGDERGAILLAGQWAAVAGLLAAGSVSVVLRFAAPGALLWILAGALAGMALEKGSSRVRVLPIPAPPRIRRVLYAPAALLVGWSLYGTGVLFTSDRSHNIAIFYAKQQMWDRALDHFSRVSAWADNGVMARYFSGNVYLDRSGPGDLEAALARYHEVEDIYPHYVQVDFQKASAYKKMHNWAAAAECLKRSVRIDPLLPQAHQALAEASLRLKRKDEALEAALQLVRIDPNNPKHWIFVSEQYEELGRKRAARRMLRKARQVDDLARKGRAQPVY